MGVRAWRGSLGTKRRRRIQVRSEHEPRHQQELEHHAWALQVAQPAEHLEQQGSHALPLRIWIRASVLDRALSIAKHELRDERLHLGNTRIVVMHELHDLD